MNKFWSPFVDLLEPYVPGEQPREGEFIKLNSNESPFPAAPEVVEAIKLAADGALQLYPAAESAELRNVVADYYGIEVDQVFVGNGSDEALGHAFNALFRHEGKKLVYPDLSYSFYPVYARLYDIEVETIPVTEDFRINIDDYCALNPAEVSSIIFPNPNAPTSVALTLDEIERLLKAQPDMLVAVDEAYVDFGAETAIKLIHKYSNLIVFQTLSKSRSLAGLRVGFAFGQAELMQALTRVKNSFNSYPIDRLAQAGAIAAFQAEDYFQETRQKIIRSREKLTTELTELGFEVLPSAANFVFATHPEHKAEDLALALRQQKILVRHFKIARCAPYLRITIGLEEECEALVNALKDFLSA
ncbi:MAG: histidinol-phosphate transaminase [Alcaligenaceae bacterium]|nr:histidinol-phosphate transaminase [Alcaligenaceae bacterium]